MPRAPRAAKKDIHPKTLNIDYLQTLTRLQIQGLAKVKFYLDILEQSKSSPIYWPRQISDEARALKLLRRGFQMQQRSQRNPQLSKNSKKPTTQDIHELHKVLVELGEERDKLRNKLNESKLSLAYAMDALESGALLRLLQADDLESMRADARKDWQEYLEEEGWNDWTPELS